MDENPYEASQVPRDSGRDRLIRWRLRGARVTIAFLIVVILFQWLCHLLTATTLIAYLRYAEYGPTARALDSAIYGVVCIAGNSIAAACAGAVAAFSLARFYDRLDGD